MRQTPMHRPTKPPPIVVEVTESPMHIDRKRGAEIRPPADDPAEDSEGWGLFLGLVLLVLAIGLMMLGSLLGTVMGWGLK